MLSLWPGSPPWWGCLHHALGHWHQGNNLQVGNPLRVKSVKGRTVPVRWITGWGCHCPPTISPSHPTPAQMLAIISPDSIHVKLCWGAKKASSGYPRAVQCQKFGNCVSLDNSFLWLKGSSFSFIFWLKGSSFPKAHLSVCPFLLSLWSLYPLLIVCFPSSQDNTVLSPVPFGAL